jgi:cobalt transporter subunit CbtA
MARLLRIAACAGLPAGMLLTLLQRIEIVPLIRHAELFEPGGSHEAPPALWATLGANVVLATGFALLLAAAISLDRRADWRRGMLWGAAGYLAFFVAPSFGLAPELPGAESAPLADRQLWWVATVAACALGLALIVFARSLALRAAGLVVIAGPFAIGAPEHAIHAHTVPVEIDRAFARAAYLVNGVLWLGLGAAVGFLSAPRPARDKAG